MKPIQILTAGTAALIIVMGIGRFSYTPILPFMQQDLPFSNTTAGFIASFNYFGYLIGAFITSFLLLRKSKTYYLKVHLVLNITTTLLMGLTHHIVLWSLLRLISGISSGVVFVLASSLVLEALEKANRPSWSGVFYSGVGIGILLSGIVVPMMNHFGWEWAWLGLGVISIVLSILVFTWMPKAKSSTQGDKDKKENYKQQHPFFKWLLFSYLFEGIGYIITATFLVAIVKGIPQLTAYASLSWTFVGLAAIPSCYFWMLVAKKYGHIKALYIAYTTQIIGIILPVFTHSGIGVFLGAFFFGGTFMGITTLTISKGKRLTTNSHQSIGYLTAAYGIGQIIGPMIAGILSSHTHRYNDALIFASIILLIGMVSLLKGHLSQLNTRKTVNY